MREVSGAPPQFFALLPNTKFKRACGEFPSGKYFPYSTSYIDNQEEAHYLIEGKRRALAKGIQHSIMLEKPQDASSGTKRSFQASIYFYRKSLVKQFTVQIFTSPMNFKGFLHALFICLLAYFVANHIGERKKSKGRELQAANAKKSSSEVFFPIVTLRNTKNNKAEEVSRESLRVQLPFNPNCAALGQEAQKVFDRLHLESQLPSAVSFYGTDSYAHLDIRDLAAGNRIEDLYLTSDEGTYYLNEDKTLWKATPTTINCHFRNVSFVQMDPTGTTMCRGYVVMYNFRKKTFSYSPYRSEYCSKSN